MWNEIVSVLVQFESTAIVSIVGILLFSGINLALVHFGAWTPRAFGGYGLFGRLRGGRMIALAFLLLRSLLFITFAVSPAAVQSVHVWYGLFLTVCILLLLRDISIVPFDLFYVASICITLYARGRLLATSSMENRWLGGALFVLTGVVAALISLLSFQQGIKSLITSKRASSKTDFMRLLRQSAVPAAASLATVLLIALLGKAGTMILHDPVFQNDGGKVVTYSGVSTIRRTSSTCTMQTGTGKSQSLLTGPLYFEGKNEIITTADTIIVQPTLSRLSRLPSMSSVAGSGGAFRIETDGSSATVKDFFLYDGKNNYIFTEPVTLKWGNESLGVPALSTINVQYGSQLEVFDRDKRTLIQKNIGTNDVTVTLSSQARVDLCSDLLYGTSGQQQMLFIQPDLLSDFK